MKRVLASFMCALFVGVLASPASGLPAETRADLLRYAQRWDSIRQELVAKRQALGPGDPKNPNDPTRLMSKELSRKIAHARAKALSYRRASQTRNFHWSVASDTWTGTTRDLAEVTGVFLSKWRQWALPLVTGGWADVTKLAIDSVLRQKIRKGIRARLDCGSKGLPRLEDDLVEIVTGTRETAKGANEDYVKNKAVESSLESLKKVYASSVEKQMKEKIEAAAVDSTEKISKWTKGYAKKVTEKVMSRIDAASFASDVGFKLWMWFDLKDQVEAQTNHLVNLRKRYAGAGRPLSCDEAYDVWKKKAEIPLPQKGDPPEPSDDELPSTSDDKPAAGGKKKPSSGKPSTPADPPERKPGAKDSGDFEAHKTPDKSDKAGGKEKPSSNNPAAACMARAHEKYMKRLKKYDRAMADPELPRHKKELLKRQQRQYYDEYQKEIVECAE